MKTFQIHKYEAVSPKLPRGRRITFAMVADLHGFCYGEEQSLLLKAVLSSGSDMVLCGGDMILRTDAESFTPALDFFRGLSGKLPVYISMGNHEERLWQESLEGCPKGADSPAAGYMAYEEALLETGAYLLKNERFAVEHMGVRLDIAGLSLPLAYYRKPFPPRLKPDQVEGYLGKAAGDRFQILLAHDPRFSSCYFSWGADLTLAGHYHGGLVRFSENICLASPYFSPFPRYAVGEFRRGSQYLYVSPGLGEHSVPIRIHNPRELLIVTVMGG